MYKVLALTFPSGATEWNHLETFSPPHFKETKESKSN